MALVTTFATTPLVTYLYPPWYQKRMDAWRRGEVDLEGNPIQPGDDASSQGTLGDQKVVVTKFSKTTVLLRLESMPSILTLVNLLTGERAQPEPKVHRSKAVIPEENPPPSRSLISKRPLEVHGVRLVELTQRTSTVMQVSEVDELQERDPVINVFRSFGKFLNMAISAALFITPEDSFAETLVAKAADHTSDLLLIPWSETGTISDAQDPQYANAENRFTTQQHNLFISKALDTAACTTAIMVNRGFGGPSMERTLTRAISQISIRSPKNADPPNPVPPVADPSHHVFFPFFGGPDDTIAMRFVLQLATNTNVTATIVRVVYKAGVTEEPLDLPAPASIHRPDLPRGLSMSNVPTLSGEDTAKDPTVKLQPTVSNSTVPDAEGAFFQSMADSVPAAISQRVLFETAETAQPIHYVISKAKEEVGLSKNAGDLVILGRSQLDIQTHIRRELVSVLASLGAPSGAGNETRKCLGDVAEAVIVSGAKASIIVLKASE